MRKINKLKEVEIDKKKLDKELLIIFSGFLKPPKMLTKKNPKWYCEWNNLLSFLRKRTLERICETKPIKQKREVKDDKETVE